MEAGADGAGQMPIPRGLLGWMDTTDVYEYPISQLHLQCNQENICETDRRRRKKNHDF